MIRIAILSALLLVAWPHSVTAATVDVQSALPPGARLLSQAPIEAQPSDVGVTFLAPEPTVGVIERSAIHDRLIWSRVLPFAGDVHEAVSRPDLLEGSGTSGTSARAEVFAYLIRDGRVTSAIAGHPHGIATGDEGITLHGEGFNVERRYATHVGVVVYVTVSEYRWQSSDFVVTHENRKPLLSKSQYPRPNAVVKTKTGDTILLRLEVAATEAQRQSGLMNRTSLDPDSGMIFVWDQPVLESFWMENTLIPLSIAFLGSDGTVHEIQEMAPLSLDLHTPAGPYQYAIEANTGFFKAAGIQVGDRMQLDLGS